jgi:hypothetical protein
MFGRMSGLRPSRFVAVVVCCLMLVVSGLGGRAAGPGPFLGIPGAAAAEAIALLGVICTHDGGTADLSSSDMPADPERGGCDHPCCFGALSRFTVDQPALRPVSPCDGLPQPAPRRIAFDVIESVVPRPDLAPARHGARAPPVLPV